MENCLFCKIVEGQIAGKIVYPRRHIASMADLTPEDGPMLAMLFSVATKLAQKLGLAERGYRFVTNVGPDAGQSVFHLHFHLLGGRQFSWPPG